MTNFNERTNTLLYKNIYLTLYSRKGWCWLCVRGELETRTDCNILTQSSSDHSSTSSSFWLVCSTVGHWGPKLSVWSWFSLRWHLISNCNWNWLTGTDPSRLWHLVIFLLDIHLIPVGVCICHHHRIQPRPEVKVIFQYLRLDAPVSLFFRLFTQVHLLIDGSVEGQYIIYDLYKCYELQWPTWKSDSCLEICWNWTSFCTLLEQCWKSRFCNMDSYKRSVSSSKACFCHI